MLISFGYSCIDNGATGYCCGNIAFIWLHPTKSMEKSFLNGSQGEFLGGTSEEMLRIFSLGLFAMGGIWCKLFIDIYCVSIV
jgi:hypothetical protein